MKRRSLFSLTCVIIVFLCHPQSSLQSDGSENSEIVKIIEIEVWHPEVLRKVHVKVGGAGVIDLDSVVNPGHLHVNCHGDAEVMGIYLIDIQQPHRNSDFHWFFIIF